MITPMSNESLPRIAYDTSICAAFERRGISAADWALVRKYILKHYEYCMSPITLYELLVGLEHAQAQYFLKSQRAFKAFYPSHAKSFLQLPRYFVLEHIFGRHVEPPDHIATDLDRWCRAILKARRKSEIESGTVTLPGYRGGFGLHLDKIVRQIKEKQEGYVDAFENLRSIDSGQYTPELWAESVLRMIDEEATPANIGKVIGAVDAPYLFGKELWSLLRSKYDYAKHLSDLLDEQQLYYLADPTLLFICNDEKLRARVRKGRDSARIMNFEELKAEASKSIAE
jgi:hypothetical protein